MIGLICKFIVGFIATVGSVQGLWLKLGGDE